MKIKNKEKTKFLFVSSDKFPPFRVDVAVLFGKELHPKHRIDYLLQSEDDCNKFRVTKWLGARVFVGATDNGSSMLHRIRKHFWGLINDLRMIKLAKDEKYDFIQVRDKFIAAIGALVVSKIVGCKFVYWISFPFPESDVYEYKMGTARYPILYLVRGNILKFLLYKIILPAADHVFAQSEKMKADFCSKGISANKITAVPMGVDLDDHSQLYGNLDSGTRDSHDPTVIYVGTMEKKRRIDFLLRVFAIVLKQVPNAKLCLVGDSTNSEDLPALKKEAEKLMIKKSTRFTGFIPRLDALRYVQSSTVCVSPIFPNPIYIPSSPTKIVEYLLMKKPVVANDIPDQLRVIQESGGGYCVKWDEAAFAEAIIALIYNPGEAQKMGQKGYAYVRRYRSYKALSDMVEKKYIQLLT